MAKKTGAKIQDRHVPTTGNGNAGTDTAYGAGGASGTTPGRESMISPEDIAIRAYSIYEGEGRSEGRAMDHWLRAESELRAERKGGRAQTGPQTDLPRSARLHQSGANSPL